MMDVLSAVNQSSSQPAQGFFRGPTSRVALFVLSLLASLRSAQSSHLRGGDECKNLLDRVNAWGGTLAQRFDIKTEDNSPYINIPNEVLENLHSESHSEAFNAIKMDYLNGKEAYLKHC